MKFQKGNTKGKGRPKGVGNKVTSDIKEKFAELLDSYDIEQMKRDLEVLKPEDRLKIVSGLLAYYIPKQSHSTIEAEGLPPITFIHGSNTD